MQELTKRKSQLAFITSAMERERGKQRRIVVEVPRDGYGFTLRLEGMRTRFELSWNSAFNLACQKAAEALRAQRKAARNKGRGNAA